MGLHLRRTDLGREAVDELAATHGGRVGLAGVLDDLAHRGRPSLLAARVGREVDRAFTWDLRDRYGIDWYPQGLTGSCDAADSGLVEGRELLVVSWYSRRGHGSRVTVVDLRTLRYQHVRLVLPDLEPLRVHAGGLVWHGPWLHVAATGRGLYAAALDDVLRLDGELVLPVTLRFRSGADRGEARQRWSFLSLDRSGPAPALVAGEYARRPPARLVRYALDPATSLPVCDSEGIARPETVHPGGVPSMQGVAVQDSTWFVTTSRGYLTRGSLHAGRPGAFTEHRAAVPMGPEDLCSWPARGELWSLSEHPWARWVFAVRPGPD